MEFVFSECLDLRGTIPGLVATFSRDFEAVGLLRPDVCM